MKSSPFSDQGATVMINIAEAQRIIDQDASLSLSRRRQLRTALSALAQLHPERQPEVISLDPVRSTALMESPSAAAALGVQATTMSNNRSALRAALRHLGILAPPAGSPKVVGGPWFELLQGLPAGYEFERLRAFLSWCDAQGLAPQSVTQQTLESYVEQRQASRGGGKQTDHTRRVIGMWRRAARTIEGWPQTALDNPDPRQTSLDFNAYPAPLEAEVRQYLTAIGTPGDIFDEIPGVQREPLSKASVRTRHYGARSLLWGALQGGIPIQRLNRVHALVEPDVIKAAIRWHMGRKGLLNVPGQRRAYIDSHIATLVATVASVANYLNLPSDEAKLVKQVLAPLKLDPHRSQGLIDRHERILDALDDRSTRARLLHLPGLIMTEARRLLAGWTDRFGEHAPQPVRAAWLASVAIGIEIELHLPLRLEDLTNLRLGHEIRLASASGSRERGTLYIEQTAKTRVGIQAPLQPETMRRLREYLDKFRPLLPNAQSTWLFPGENSADEPRNKVAFGTAIGDAVAQFIGLRINVHAFRCIAGGLILEADRNAIDDVRALLGHSGFDTALRYYRRFSTRAAANNLGQIIAHQRRATPTPPVGVSPGRRNFETRKRRKQHKETSR